MDNENEIILYQPDKNVKLEVRLKGETVWLTQAQIGELFGTGRQAITKHLKNIFNSEELQEDAVCSILELTAADGKTYKTKTYNLDAILSVGYRVNSKNATLFRQWANKVLKDYLLRGYAINRRLEKLEKTVADHTEKIDFFVRTSLPPVDKEVYHIGASLKDLGKKWFAFARLHLDTQELIERINKNTYTL